VYIAYAVATVAVFRLRPPMQAALISILGGWMFLPVADYPARFIVSEQYTVDVIGTLLPSSLLITKALICPIVVLACLALHAPHLFRAFRPARLDAAIAAFCLSPLIAWAAGRVPAAAGLVQAGYLAGTWGMAWMIGRLVLSDRSGREGLVTALIVSGLVLLPVAILEGLQPPGIYARVFGPHPFQTDGAARYLGFRPVGFFEHGNQYGIWVAMAALAAFGRALLRRRRTDAMIAGLLVLCAIASQSAGAIILLLLGVVWLLASARVRRIGIVVTAALLVTGGPGYVSGKLPLEYWAKSTAAGQVVYHGLREAGRGSLGWRVKRDQEALPTIQRAALTGYGVWDWWRPLGSHPSGLPLLIVGQFGVLSLIFATIAIFGGALRESWAGRSGILAVIVIAAGVDSWLNSYAYFPAILAAAALARPAWRSKLDSTAAGAGQTLESSRKATG